MKFLTVLNSYHNTTRQTGQILLDFTAKAETQDGQVLQLFHIYGKLSPSKAHQLLNLPNVPITSIRRSITNLSKSGKLTMTNEMTNGSYGRLEHIWEIL